MDSLHRRCYSHWCYCCCDAFLWWAQTKQIIIMMIRLQFIILSLVIDSLPVSCAVSPEASTDCGVGGADWNKYKKQTNRTSVKLSMPRWEMPKFERNAYLLIDISCWSRCSGCRWHWIRCVCTARLAIDSTIGTRSCAVRKFQKCCELFSLFSQGTVVALRICLIANILLGGGWCWCCWRWFCRRTSLWSIFCLFRFWLLEKRKLSVTIGMNSVEFGFFLGTNEKVCKHTSAESVWLVVLSLTASSSITRHLKWLNSFALV